MILATTPSVEDRSKSADAVVGIDIDYKIILAGMMMVSASGMAGLLG